VRGTAFGAEKGCLVRTFLNVSKRLGFLGGALM
jgi:hypothetical protein